MRANNYKKVNDRVKAISLNNIAVEKKERRRFYFSLFANWFTGSVFALIVGGFLYGYGLIEYDRFLTYYGLSLAEYPVATTELMVRGFLAILADYQLFVIILVGLLFFICVLWLFVNIYIVFRWLYAWILRKDNMEFSSADKLDKFIGAFAIGMSLLLTFYFFAESAREGADERAAQLLKNTVQFHSVAVGNQFSKYHKVTLEDHDEYKGYRIICNKELCSYFIPLYDSVKTFKRENIKTIETMKK